MNLLSEGSAQVSMIRQPIDTPRPGMQGDAAQAAGPTGDVAQPTPVQAARMAAMRVSERLRVGGRRVEERPPIVSPAEVAYRETQTVAALPADEVLHFLPV